MVAPSVKHPYVSPITDGGDPNLVGPDEWNDGHTIIGLQRSDEKAAANGYAPLDSGILVPIAYLPTGTGGTQVALGNHGHTHAATTGQTANDHHNQAHVLASGTALGGDHTISGAAAGEVLRALSGTTAAFDQLAHADLGSVTSDQHHAQLHAAAHASGAGDAIKLDDLASPDDNTDLNASTSAHGLLKKLPNDASKFLDGTGAFTTPAGSSGDAILGQSGVGGARISGLQGNPDIDAAGGSDDEFNTTDTSDPMTGWTTLGTPTAHDINSTVKGHYYIKKSAAAGVGWHGIYKAVPGLPDTIITKIAALNGKNQFNTAAIFFGESPPGKMETIGIRFSANQQCRVEHDSWTGPTGTGAAITTGADMYPYAGPLWVKLVLTSSSSISVYLSTNGLLWLPFTIARNPGFTIGVAGLVVDCENASDDVEGLFDWIRYT